MGMSENGRCHLPQSTPGSVLKKAFERKDQRKGKKSMALKSVLNNNLLLAFSLSHLKPTAVFLIRKSVKLKQL